MNIEAIEKALEAKLQELHIPGGAAVIVKDDLIVFMKAFGLRDVECKLPVTLDTLFPICSCTKAFTAMAAAICQDDGTLSLDDSPRKYLPYFHLYDPEADAQTTIRDLLCHRVGLMGTDTLVVADSGHALSQEDLIRAVGSAKPTARFREKFQYSNVLFTVAGEAIAKANHTSWEQVMVERIFKPLSMTASVTSKQAMERSGDYTMGYQYDAATGQNQKMPYPDWISLIPSSGAIVSNIRDMTQWLRLMLGGGVFEGKRLVSEKSFQELIAPHILQSDRKDEKYSLCLGWYTFDWNGHRVVQANGSTAGFFASMACMPQERIGMVILTQLGTGQCDPAFLWPLILGKPEPPSASETAPGAPASASPPVVQESSAGPLSADELIARMIEALGGEATLRKHTTMVVRSRRVYVNQGLVSEETLQAEAPNASALQLTWKAAGKKIATVRVVFDGVQGFQEASFMARVDFAGSDLENRRLDAAFAPLLEARTLYKSLTITGMEKLGEEEVYVLVKTPEQGTPVTDYVSARTFLLVKRETPGETTLFSDYRPVDGQLVPFKMTSLDRLGESHSTIKTVIFNETIPASAFQAKNRKEKSR